MYVPSNTAAAGNYASIANAVHLQVVDDIEIVVRVALDSWQMASSAYILNRSLSNDFHGLSV
jgi:hypothetical protein